MRSPKRKSYFKKILENPLPPLQEDERIYLNVTYQTRAFAQYTNCGFDRERKLWFTGVHNSNLLYIVQHYGVNEEATSEKAKKMLIEKTEEIKKRIYYEDR